MKKIYKLFCLFAMVFSFMSIVGCAITDSLPAPKTDDIGDSDYYVKDDRIYHKPIQGKPVVGEYDGFLFDSEGAIVADKEFIEIAGFTLYLVENYVQYNYQVINNYVYNFNVDGRMVKGTHIDGYTYGEDGKIIASNIFIKSNGNTYYVVNNVIVFGYQVINNFIYNFGTDGKMITGRHTDGYVYDDEGKMVGNNIFVTINGDTYYLINNVIVLGYQIINNYVYNFGTDGKMITGEYDGYTYDAEGKMIATNIFIVVQGNTYYIINNVIIFGYQVINNYIYNFGNDGKMVTGEYEDGYNYGTDGKLIANNVFITINGDTYYLINNVVVIGLQVINNYVYNFDADGKMITGEHDGYSYDAEGKMVANNIFITVQGSTYYIVNNIIVFGQQIINNYIYNFGTDGKMVTGGSYTEDGKMIGNHVFVVINGDTYYLINNVVVIGFQVINNFVYNFGTDGKMITGEAGDGYTYTEDGKLIADNVFIEVNGNKYYVVNNVIVVGYRIINNQYYNFGTDGKMATGSNADGYTYSSDGYLVADYLHITIEGVQYIIVNNYLYLPTAISGTIYKSDHTTTFDDNVILNNVICKVIINGYVFTQYSLADGSFSFDGIPATEVTLQFELYGYITSVIVIDISVTNNFVIIMDKEVSNVLTGKIVIADADTNNTNNSGLRDALVEITRTSSTNVWHYTTYTDAYGNYRFDDLTAGIYDIVVSKDGYYTIQQTVTVRENEVTIQNMTIEAIPSTQVNDGYASGTIKDARTGRAVPDMTLYIIEGLNLNGNLVATLTTNASGQYNTGALKPGLYIVKLVDERTLDNEDYRYGTITFTIKVLSDVTISNQDATISNSVGLEVDGMRIVLTWGSTPNDLDSHLYVDRNSMSDYHVYYGEKAPTSSSNLDVDDTSSYGPETVTISSMDDGIYYYYIHDYTNRFNSSSTYMANSGATIRVYFGTDSSPAYTFYVPSGAGIYWHVFTYNSMTGEFIVVNTISNSAPMA